MTFAHKRKHCHQISRVPILLSVNVISFVANERSNNNRIAVTSFRSLSLSIFWRRASLTSRWKMYDFIFSAHQISRLTSSVLFSVRVLLFFSLRLLFEFGKSVYFRLFWTYCHWLLLSSIKLKLSLRGFKVPVITHRHTYSYHRRYNKCIKLFEIGHDILVNINFHLALPFSISLFALLFRWIFCFSLFELCVFYSWLSPAIFGSLLLFVESCGSGDLFLCRFSQFVSLQFSISSVGFSPSVSAVGFPFSISIAETHSSCWVPHFLFYLFSVLFFWFFL